MATYKILSIYHGNLEGQGVDKACQRNGMKLGHEVKLSVSIKEIIKSDS